MALVPAIRAAYKTRALAKTEIARFSIGYNNTTLIGIRFEALDILKFGIRLARAARTISRVAGSVDDRALAEMVALAQARAPERTGRLRGGITGHREGDELVFKAEASLSEDTADYAPFVERGTRAGVRNRVVADQTYYERKRGIRRRARRTHPGTAAQPFFYSSAQEVLERRRIEQERVLARAAATDLVEA